MIETEEGVTGWGEPAVEGPRRYRRRRRGRTVRLPGLLSNPAVMRDDAVDRSEAWRIFDQLWADERVLWAEESAELDAVLRVISAREHKRHKLQTDGYLEGFARASGIAHKPPLTS